MKVGAAGRARFADEFVEVLYRNVGSIIGDSLGNWVLHQMVADKESHYERIKGLMEPGVCYAPSK